ncbi:MAG TPA: DUF1688 family protein [Polyangiaceae bacterium]|nr:DUF1688 family protein [Polyangiaceae bacterium]
MHIGSEAALAFLRSPAAVRQRCESVFEFVRLGQSRHFRLNLAALPRAIELTWQVTGEAYPDPARIPVHSRVNHFGVGGIDRLSAFEAQLGDARERARALTDLIVTSVLLDAGAGNAWRYTEAGSGLCVGRSEGLALASFHCLQGGVFSSDPAQPLRADAAGLAALSAERLGAAFQVSADNPLLGLEGRAALLRKLGGALTGPAFAGLGRVGGLCDALIARSSGGRLPASVLLGTVLEALAPIWPPRTQYRGVELGDVWSHRAASGGSRGGDEQDAADIEAQTKGLVPFHKLSQWLSYSLFHPLAVAGVEVVEPDELTGLAEYRNGGLFYDTQVLLPKHDGVTRDVHLPGSELVVEWRALTVALLDRLAQGLRERTGLDAERLPLGKVLEGGSWAAGRRLASERRQGAPPIRVESDGTLF